MSSNQRPITKPKERSRGRKLGGTKNLTDDQVRRWRLALGVGGEDTVSCGSAGGLGNDRQRGVKGKAGGCLEELDNREIDSSSTHQSAQTDQR